MLQVTGHNLCVFVLCTAYVQPMSRAFLIRRTERYITLNVCWSSCKVPVILVRVSKNTQMSYFKKIRPVEAKLF